MLYCQCCKLSNTFRPPEFQKNMENSHCLWISINLKLLKTSQSSCLKKTGYYCWWKNSCTTWDVWNLMNNGIKYLSTGAGFQPSTVVHYSPDGVLEPHSVFVSAAPAVHLGGCWWQMEGTAFWGGFPYMSRIRDTPYIGKYPKCLVKLRMIHISWRTKRGGYIYWRKPQRNSFDQGTIGYTPNSVPMEFIGYTHGTKKNL